MKLFDSVDCQVWIESRINLSISPQAADLMLGSKIRRLPVVDKDGFPLG